MKKIPSLIAATLMIVVTVCSFFTGCGQTEKNGEQITLKVMSWEDYIDTDDYEDEESGLTEGSVIEEFEKYCKETLGKNVKVEYSTVGTNEEMYTKINLNKESYDLVCPSEYMIQKMIGEKMFPADCIEDYKKVGGTPWLDFKHTVFGQAYEGMDVVDEIAKTRVDLMDKPFDDVVIEKIEIGEYEG